MKVKFTACAAGTPDPTIEWFRDGVRLYNNDRIRIEQESSGLLRLTINDCNERDVGRYSCRAYNPHGEETCHAELTYDSKYFFMV